MDSACCHGLAVMDSKFQEGTLPTHVLTYRRESTGVVPSLVWFSHDWWDWAIIGESFGFRMSPMQLLTCNLPS